MTVDYIGALKAIRRERDDAVKSNAVLVGCLLNVALLVPTVLWRGWVIAVMWRWFLVPLGVPEIGVIHAAGISTFAGLFRMGLAMEKPEAKTMPQLASFINNGLLLLAAWCIHAFM